MVREYDSGFGETAPFASAVHEILGTNLQRTLLGGTSPAHWRCLALGAGAVLDRGIHPAGRRSGDRQTRQADRGRDKQHYREACRASRLVVLFLSSQRGPSTPHGSLAAVDAAAWKRNGKARATPPT